jgi:GR25 family glycosyltransferase involved in LPS biosynthesis
MKIYCICLPKRRKHADNFFEVLNIKPIYTDIVTIDDLKKMGLKKLKSDGIVDSTYKIKNDTQFGKIACSLSHINALKEFLKSKEEIALIFEDDNHIPTIKEAPLIMERLDNIIYHLNKQISWQFCNLSPCLSYKKYQQSIGNDLYIGSLGWCMNSYLVKPQGARYLINRLPLSEAYHTLDTFLQLYGRNYPKQAIDVHPRLFRQKDNHSYDSTLGNIPFSKDGIDVVNEYTNNHPKDVKNFNYNILVIIISVVIIVLLLIIGIKFLSIYVVLMMIAIILFVLLKFISGENVVSIQKSIDWEGRVDDLFKSMSTESPHYNDLYAGGNEGYRLGDMILWPKWRHHETGEQYHLENFPTSIASNYMRTTTKRKQYNILHSLIQVENAEKPPKNALVIHLRLGDVLTIHGGDIPIKDFLIKQQITNNAGYVKPLRYFFEKIPIIQRYGIKNIILVAGSHFKVPCKRSHTYIHAVQKFFEQMGFNVSTRLGKKSDDDFIYMSSADFYIPSGGGYSSLIQEMIKLSNNRII